MTGMHFDHLTTPTPTAQQHNSTTTAQQPNSTTAHRETDRHNERRGGEREGEGEGERGGGREGRERWDGAERRASGKKALMVQKCARTLTFMVSSILLSGISVMKSPETTP